MGTLEGLADGTAVGSLVFEVGSAVGVLVGRVVGAVRGRCATLRFDCPLYEVTCLLGKRKQSRAVPVSSLATRRGS